MVFCCVRWPLSHTHTRGLSFACLFSPSTYNKPTYVEGVGPVVVARGGRPADDPPDEGDPRHGLHQLWGLVFGVVCLGWNEEVNKTWQARGYEGRSHTTYRSYTHIWSYTHHHHKTKTNTTPHHCALPSIVEKEKQKTDLDADLEEVIRLRRALHAQQLPRRVRAHLRVRLDAKGKRIRLVAGGRSMKSMDRERNRLTGR